VAILAKVSEEEERIVPATDAPLPSVEALSTIVELVKVIVFPGFFDKRQIDSNIRSYHIGVNMERLLSLLKQQIELALLFDAHDDGEAASRDSQMLAMKFIDRLPEIKRLLYTDVEAIFNDDPAVRNYSEVIFCYPVVEAMIHYRVAHELLSMGIAVIPASSPSRLMPRPVSTSTRAHASANTSLSTTARASSSAKPASSATT
jgi:serine O-acetyltransferase